MISGIQIHAQHKLRTTVAMTPITADDMRSSSALTRFRHVDDKMSFSISKLCFNFWTRCCTSTGLSTLELKFKGQQQADDAVPLNTVEDNSVVLMVLSKLFPVVGMPFGSFVDVVLQWLDTCALLSIISFSLCWNVYVKENAFKLIVDIHVYENIY